MKRLLTAAAAAITALAVAYATPANAALMSAGACVPGSLATPCAAGAAITSTSTNTLSVPSTVVGAFSISGSAQDGTSATAAFFNSQTIQISTTAGGLLDIYFTVQNVPTQSVPLSFTSTFTSNQQNATTHSVIESTFLSNANGLFDAGLSTPLSTATLNNAVLQTAGPFSVTHTPASTVSLTELYQIELIGCAGQPAGTCTGNLTIDLSAQQVASEPASVALLGIGLLGLGYIVSRKRRSNNAQELAV